LPSAPVICLLRKLAICQLSPLPRMAITCTAIHPLSPPRRVPTSYPTSPSPHAPEICPRLTSPSPCMLVTCPPFSSPRMVIASGVIHPPSPLECTEVIRLSSHLLWRQQQRQGPRTTPCLGER
jgi:hypothetical protein